MKQAFLASTLLVLGSLIASQVAMASTQACSHVVAAPKSMEKIANWRLAPTSKQNTEFMSLTNPSQTGGYAKTSPARERNLKDYAQQVVEEVWINDIDAIAMHLEPQVGTSLFVISPGGDYMSGKIELSEVRNVGPDGILHATLAVPVSGRYGQAETMKWALNDTYDIMIGDANGQNRRPLISKAKSRMLVTMQEIEIPLKKGEIVTLFYERSGSAGSAGFPEGRILRLKWSGY